MSFMFFDPDWAEIIGVFGFALYVSNYTMLTTRVLSGDSITYFALNLSAASLVLIGLSTNFNLASALIQLFFITMSAFAILLRMIRRGQERRRLHDNIQDPRWA